MIIIIKGLGQLIARGRPAERVALPISSNAIKSGEKNQNRIFVKYLDKYLCKDFYKFHHVRIIMLKFRLSYTPHIYDLIIVFVFTFLFHMFLVFTFTFYRVSYTPHLRFENDTKAASIPNFEWADLRSVFKFQAWVSSPFLLIIWVGRPQVLLPTGCESTFLLILALISRTEYYEYFEPENRTVTTMTTYIFTKC